MADRENDGAWFLPKRFGYGSGRPIAWQGWLMVALHVAVVAGGAVLLHRQPAAKFAWVLIAVLLPIPLYAAKTRGGWKWRSGR
jgi:hypothetical protein